MDRTLRKPCGASEVGSPSLRDAAAIAASRARRFGFKRRRIGKPVSAVGTRFGMIKALSEMKGSKKAGRPGQKTCIKRG
jgi:hypothetical protein